MNTFVVNALTRRLGINLEGKGGLFGIEIGKEKRDGGCRCV
jgi:hypothetical protein